MTCFLCYQDNEVDDGDVPVWKRALMRKRTDEAKEDEERSKVQTTPTSCSSLCIVLHKMACSILPNCTRSVA